MASPRIHIEISSGIGATEVPEDVAEDLEKVFATLENSPSNRQAVAECDSTEDAKLFVRQAKAWAAQNGLAFARKGSAKTNPTRVAFRVYRPRENGSQAA